MLTPQSLIFIEVNGQTGGPIWNYAEKPWHPGKGAKPDHVIQLNCREVRTHASYETTRTSENFNNRGTKMIILSEELWLIANTSKSLTGVNQ